MSIDNFVAFVNAAFMWAALIFGLGMLGLFLTGNLE